MIKKPLNLEKDNSLYLELILKKLEEISLKLDKSKRAKKAKRKR